MSLFGNKKKELPALISDAELDGATYDQVIDFLVGVNDKDYAKIFRVADIYRGANVEVAKATGVKAEPVRSIFERQSVPARTIDPGGSLLDEDDELVAAFLGSEDDEPAPAKPTRHSKTTKVTIDKAEAK